MKNARVNEIDLLRFIAAFAVVLFHYTFRGYAADDMSKMPYPLLAPIFQYGYLGVELFFMISGFVILMTAANGSLRNFFVSRLVRLYPAFWACCTITSITIFFIGAPRFEISIEQYLINMTMFSGFVGVPSIDGAYWSLFVEMRFYALVVLVLVLGRIHQAQLFLSIWLLVASILALLPVDTLIVKLFRYFFIVDFAAFFVSGATFYLIWAQGLSLKRVLMVIVCWLLALHESIGFLPVLEAEYKVQMSSYVVGIVVSTFFIIMLLISLGGGGIFGRRRWAMAGALTYPLYLLHQHIGYMFFNALYPQVDPHILLWGTILFVILLSYAVHVFIEKKYSNMFKNMIVSALDRIARQWVVRNEQH